MNNPRPKTSPPGLPYTHRDARRDTPHSPTTGKQIEESPDAMAILLRVAGSMERLEGRFDEQEEWQKAEFDRVWKRIDGLEAGRLRDSSNDLKAEADIAAAMTHAQKLERSIADVKSELATVKSSLGDASKSKTGDTVIESLEKRKPAKAWVTWATAFFGVVQAILEIRKMMGK